MAREYVLQPFRAPVELQIDYARELNEQQCAAVTAAPGPALVIAGAGSGKTRTLTYRVAYLIEQGIPPERVLLLTFTNKAAKEMMRRVADLVGGNLSSLWGGTFHSVAARLLRRHADRLGYRPDYTILDREDTKDLLKASIADAQIDVKATRFPKPDVLADIFSLAANTEKPVVAILESQYDFFLDRADDIERVRKRFIERKRTANVMDFDDLLIFLLRLLQKEADIAERYQSRFQFILVDEYQDTNRIQSDLVDLLAAKHHNVMVVGDDSQSIYSWRGAHFQNILRFPERYPEAKLYKIETNYRSTPEILALANAAIAPNRQQFTKELAPSRKSGIKPIVVVCGDPAQQAAFVAQRALELRDEGIELNEMAILYRSHYHALELQLELTKRNIPFSITSGIRFFEQAHIKDVVAHIKLATNPRDELAFKRVVLLLPGIGGKGAEKLWARFSPALEKMESSTANAPAGPRIASALQACVPAVPGKAVSAWAQLSATVAQLESEPIRNVSSKMIQHILEAGYKDYLRENYPNSQTRLEDLQQLASFAVQFKTVEEFLTQMALLSSVDTEDEKPVTKDSEQIRLSTIHQAKGLEFRVVFVIMLCEGLFPTTRALERPESEEEERRLFYVAVTRAKDELYLSYPVIRPVAAYTGEIFQQRSRFLSDLPPEVAEEWNLRPYGA
ncbi:MAG: ATP-dependent helicase [Verrucomicrobiia bacterium]